VEPLFSRLTFVSVTANQMLIMTHSREEHMIRSTESARQNIKIGDRVRLRPRFSHLYPADYGVTVGVVLDPMRTLFNEYIVEFPDRTIGSLFEFQIYRDDAAIER
jgi:hypothetical protein